MGERETEEKLTIKNKKVILGSAIKNFADNAGEKAGEVAKRSAETVEKTREAVFKAVDVNGDGQIDIEDEIVEIME